jgi:hypothetical protein
MNTGASCIRSTLAALLASCLVAPDACSPGRSGRRGGSGEGGGTCRQDGHRDRQRRDALLPRRRPAGGGSDPAPWVPRDWRRVRAGGRRTGQALSAHCAGLARRRLVAAPLVGLREEDARDRRQGTDGSPRNRARPCHGPRHRCTRRLCLRRPVSRAIAEPHGRGGVHRGTRGHGSNSSASHPPIHGRSTSRASHESTTPWPSTRGRKWRWSSRS